MEKLLKEISVDTKTATKGGRKKMKAAVTSIKRGQDKILKRIKLKKGVPTITEGSSTSTNDSDDLQSDVQSSSTNYISINFEEDEEEGLNLNPLDPQISSTAENNDPRSDHADPPPFLPETDEKTSSIEITEETNSGNIIEDLESNRTRSDHSTDQKVTVEQIFVIANFILEIPTLVFDQLSSQHKVRYALLSMLMSMATLIICISELVYKGIKERIAWKWKREKKIMPWLYYPAPSSKPFGSVTDFIGVSCSIFQCIFTTAAYACYRRHSGNPIKISMWPIIFSFVLLFSKLNCRRC